MAQPTRDDFSLLAHALREAHHLSTRQLLRGNWEPAELAVLFLVFKNEAPRPSDLAAEMRLDLSTISRHIRALEMNGYLTKVKDEHDGRSFRLRLTPGGRDAIAAAMGRRAEHYRRATARWPAKDFQKLVQLLTRFVEELKQCDEP